MPDANGSARSIQEAGHAVVNAFAQAGLYSFISITALLLFALRSVRDTAICMAPIVLTGLLTMGSCVAIGQSLNFANIIALPLLFGIGVAFHIYFVVSWRSGGSHLLTSSLARAIFFSALATATGFGSLWASSHPGTASMGKLLMISLVGTLVSALLFQPALMGEPPTRGPAHRRDAATAAPALFPDQVIAQGVQMGDQSLGPAGGQRRCKIRAPNRQLTDRAVIDVDDFPYVG